AGNQLGRCGCCAGSFGGVEVTRADITATGAGEDLSGGAVAQGQAGGAAADADPEGAEGDLVVVDALVGVAGAAAPARQRVGVVVEDGPPDGGRRPAAGTHVERVEPHGVPGEVVAGRGVEPHRPDVDPADHGPAAGRTALAAAMSEDPAFGAEVRRLWGA